ncbi:MAG TPA: DedA family protein [Nitrospirae bacterium]|nr:SNARE associated Golgi protein [bacterium BMS3Abin06]HDH10749.1 DedA family protein [Nitrospirota bacterium]HDZ03037.1 DedA family protein [Nitrospirota bacterium]
MKFVKKLYDWVLHWAETPYAIPALFLLSFSESSFFPVPPDVLLITLAISIPKKAFKYALICMIASVLGGILGYCIGFYGYETVGRPIVDFYHGQDIMNAIKLKYDEYGFLGILIAAITPIPYKVFTIASGVFEFDFWSFMLASILGRSTRFFIVAGLIWKFGPAIKDFIEKYFNILSIIFVILLAGGFILIRYVF